MALLRVRVDHERVEALRKLRGFVQERLAKAAGISQTSMQRMETADGPYNADHVIGVATALDVPLAELGVPREDIEAIERRNALYAQLKRRVVTFDAKAGKRSTLKSGSGYLKYSESPGHRTGIVAQAVS